MARRKKKNNNSFKLLSIVIILVVAAFIGYSELPKLLNEKRVDNTVTNENNPIDRNNDKPTEEKEKPTTQKPAETPKKKVPPIPVKESDDQIGEIRVEGQVLAVDVNNRSIKIEQIMDDNSTKVNPLIKISKKAVIQNNDGSIKLSDLNVGSTVDIILTNKKIARSVTVVE